MERRGRMRSGDQRQVEISQSQGKMRSQKKEAKSNESFFSESNESTESDASVLDPDAAEAGDFAFGLAFLHLT